MSEPEILYSLPETTEGDELIESLAERFSIRREDPLHRQETYLDTFDWRLREAGGVLSAESGRGRRGWTLVWRVGGELRRRLAVDALPAFGWDLPEGPLRQEIEPISGIRSLLPLATWEGERTELRLLDGEEKTVARTFLERGAVRAPGGEPRPLPPRLRAVPVRGYGEAFAELVDFLEAEAGLVGAEVGELEEALAAIGRRPGDYTSKPRFAFEPEMPAGEAVKRIHRTLLGTILANEDGVRRDLDSEFLHDFRVAVRRTRSALGQVKGVLPAPVLEHFRGEFSWLGKATGPTRDLDVYLLKIGGYKEFLPEGVREDLAPLEAFLAERQKKEQARLVRALDSERYRALVEGWRHFLDGEILDGAAEEPEGERPANAERPIGEVASERIWKVYRRVEKRGSRIDDDSPAERLHQLRIDCKKLRYLLEFFRHLYPADEVGRLIKALKKLQDLLGDFNDYEVQQEHLERYAHDMAEAGRAPVPTFLAMGRLLARLADGQDGERRRFAQRFARFVGEENRESFRGLFKRRSG